MIPENRIPTHPGVILNQEFLGPLGASQVAFAAHLRVPVQRINELVRGKRGISPETAWLALEFSIATIPLPFPYPYAPFPAMFPIVEPFECRGGANDR